MKKEFYVPFEKTSSKDVLSFELVERYWRLMLLAKEARAYPSQSGFYVKTAGLAKDGTEYWGGNKEYVYGGAFVHGETAVVSGLKDATDSPIEAICWYKKEGEVVTEFDFGCPCGNCRDVLREYCDLETVLLNGNESGVVYAKLKDYLFEDFRKESSHRLHREGVVEALKAQEMAVDIYLTDELKAKKYGAALVADDGTIWRGSHYTNCGFDAVSPALAAVMNWRNSYPRGSVSKKHLHLSRLVIAGGPEMESPLYRDRQAILELDEILRMYRGDNRPLRVEMVRVGEKIDAYETNAVEWLPQPFSPGAFRWDDVTRAQLDHLIR